MPSKMTIKRLIMGPIENNVYIIGNDESAFVVDPTSHAQRIADALGDRKLEAIVLTHAHWDHVGAAKALRDLTDAPVIASAIDAPVISGEAKLDPSHRRFEPCPVDHTVEDDETIEIIGAEWTGLLTPGHTPGSMCFFFAGDDENAPILISGDTLFAGTHGRTDFVGGGPAAMKRSLARLAKLPDETKVLPGHNNLSTIGREKSWLPTR